MASFGKSIKQKTISFEGLPCWSPEKDDGWIGRRSLRFPSSVRAFPDGKLIIDYERRSHFLLIAIFFSPFSGFQPAKQHLSF